MNDHRGSIPAARPKTIYESEYEVLMKRLRQRRCGLGVTQKSVAMELDRPRQWLSKIERCEIRIDVLQFARLCKIYGLDPSTELRSVMERGAAR